MPSTSVGIEDIRVARTLLEGVVRPTPMEYSRVHTELVGTDVYLKCENLQRAGSFKIRGAYTRISRLTDEEKARGVVAASAGNHAQGVALAASLLGIKAKVFMPKGAPMPKVTATRGYGAEIELVGSYLDESMVHARRYAEETGAVLIHPFDHPDIIAGQGTVGLEILEQVPDVKTILVSLGGGGLLAGIAVAVKALKPDVRIIGVQAEGAAAYPLSLAAGHPVAAEKMSTMADGIAVGLPGEVNFPLVRDLVSGIQTVSESDLSRAALMLLERAKLVVEPAGAAAAAALLHESALALEGPIVCVLSGGNIDPLLMMRIIQNGMVAAGRYLQVSVRVPDKPGNLARILSDCAVADANVVQVEHVRTNSAIAVDEVEIGLQLETKGHQHREEVLRALRAAGYTLVFR